MNQSDKDKRKKRGQVQVSGKVLGIIPPSLKVPVEANNKKKKVAKKTPNKFRRNFADHQWKAFFTPEIPNLKKDGFAPKLYYSLADAAEIIGCKTKDLLHNAGLGNLKLHIALPDGVNIRVGNTFVLQWGQMIPGIELLALSSSDCRSIELKGTVQQQKFSYGWSINDNGQAELRKAAEAGADFWGEEGVLGTFIQGKPTSIQISSEKLFVMSFDMVDFIEDMSVAEVNGEKETLSASFSHPNRSDKLAVLLQASMKFWANAKLEVRESYPKPEAIEQWLVANHSGYSPSLAKSAVSIIRPEGAKKGAPGTPSEK